MKPRQKICDTYWYFAAERQNIFFKRFYRQNPPFSDDKIFQKYKFCNTYRASDRASQFLIKEVIYSGTDSEESMLLRILLFRLLNKIETWKALEEIFGRITYRNFTTHTYSAALEQIKSTQKTIYGNAFILCANKAFGFQKKHENHCALLEYIFSNKIAIKILNSRSLKELFTNLTELPLIGTFMAYQMALDLNYSPLFDFDENDFTVAGPGAIRGIRKCFEDIDTKDFSSIIYYMVENQEKEFKRLNIEFKSLFGRPLHASDCQGLFCETDKYCREKYPELISNRSRIKATFTANSERIEYFFPPKWKLTGDPR